MGHAPSATHGHNPSDILRLRRERQDQQEGPPPLPVAVVAGESGSGAAHQGRYDRDLAMVVALELDPRRAFSLAGGREAGGVGREQ